MMRLASKNAPALSGILVTYVFRMGDIPCLFVKDGFYCAPSSSQKAHLQAQRPSVTSG